MNFFIAGQTMVNTNTMRSASEGRGMHGSMGGTGTMRSQPQSRKCYCVSKATSDIAE